MLTTFFFKYQRSIQIKLSLAYKWKGKNWDKKKMDP